MDTNYTIACGIVWRKTGDPEAGLELLLALDAPDPCLRLIAQTLLVENGKQSVDLFEYAVANGIVDPEVGAPCMVEILQSEKRGQTGDASKRRPQFEEWLS
jgi:hypothetical protein